MKAKRSACLDRLAYIALFVLLIPVQGWAEPKVFAHYMTCCPVHGHKQTVNEFAEEMTTAQKAGIDGFILNIAAWRDPGKEYYRQITERMFLAADQLRTFSLFISLDAAGHVPVEEAIEIVSEYHERPSFFKVDGKAVVTTYAGTPPWGASIVQGLAGKGIQTVFVPAYHYPHKYMKCRLQQAATRDICVGTTVLEENPLIDGISYYGAGQDGRNLAEVISELTRAAKSRGKLAMMGVSPYYRGFGNNSRIFESLGFEGMAKQWEAAISSNADWVQLVTWNDWGEASYIAPYGQTTSQELWNGHWGRMLSHAGFLSASQYYIDWFKQRTPPVISEDRIVYVYRVHPKTSPALVNIQSGSIGRPKNADRLEDRLFVTAFLKSSAELVISIGDSRETRSLQAGVSHVSVPLKVGEPTIEFLRKGEPPAFKRLEFSIEEDGTRGNFNAFAGVFLPGELQGVNAEPREKSTTTP